MDSSSKKTREALRRLKDFKPLKLTARYTLEISFADKAGAQKAYWVPGIVCKNEHTVSFTAEMVLDMIKLFQLAKR